MKTFTILDNPVSFDEGLLNYIEIMKESQQCKIDFNNRYMDRPKRKISSMEDFALSVKDICNNEYANEFMIISECILKVYAKFGIYDMNSNLIKALNLSLLRKHLQKMNPILEEISEFTAQVNQELQVIQEKWKGYVNDAIRGNYFTVYSTDYSDLWLNEMFNLKEKDRVEKKRQKLYEVNVNKTTNEYLNQVMELCAQYIAQLEELDYNDIMETIDDMYKKCANDLVAKGKISPFNSYINDTAGNAIIHNIEVGNLTDSKIIKEQLIKALQIDSFNVMVHHKIIEYLHESDIQEYIKIIKFLRFENGIFAIYSDNYTTSGNFNNELNNKCIKILKEVKEELQIEKVITATTNLKCTDNNFDECLSSLQIIYKLLKNIYGTDNQRINEEERKAFAKVAKEAGAGTDLIYDGSLTNLNYDYLREFYAKAKKEREQIKHKKEVSSKFLNWSKKHIKSIIIFIIVIILTIYFNKE